jgi:DNA-binding MarR family transcriptional regulator
MATSASYRADELAFDLFNLLTQVKLSTLRTRRRTDDLREIEYLTLAILQNAEPMIVGDIQRLLGVLPAQMSRIIRSLESRHEPLLSCHINSHDKRKINVTLTPAGARALAAFRTGRVSRLSARFDNLSEEDREDLARLIHKLTALLEGTVA